MHFDRPHGSHANVAWNVAKDMTDTVSPELPRWVQSLADGFAGKSDLYQEIQPSMVAAYSFDSIRAIHGFTL